MSDEWTVPLCPIHHRALHDAGREEEWWRAKGIDAKTETERLWRVRQAPSTNSTHTGALPNAIEPPPSDDHGQPLPINFNARAPHGLE